MVRIPKDEPRRSKWIEFHMAASKTASSKKSSTCKVDSIRLCILHFTENYISRNKCGTPVCAMPKAVPSICNPEKIEW